MAKKPPQSIDMTILEGNKPWVTFLHIGWHSWVTFLHIDMKRGLKYE